jgi:hypothetical protein
MLKVKPALQKCEEHLKCGFSSPHPHFSTPSPQEIVLGVELKTLTGKFF